MLPFIFSDTRIAPAGVRAIGAAMVEGGFTKTRIVLQQWNRNFRPSAMRLDGRAPDLFMISSMAIHGQRAKEMIADARRIDPSSQPLILVGGPKAIYEPWDLLGAGGAPAADVAITGEEYVLLNLLEVLLAERAGKEPLRQVFLRVRDCGGLDQVPGLMYARTDARQAVQELVDTGPQRLLNDLDELPHPVHGFGLLERPSRRAGLAPGPLPASQVARHSPTASLVLTFGCRFGCHYCPIPAYNQRQYRVKSGQRIADEMRRLHDEFGHRLFFGADDNFFNDPSRTLKIVDHLARTRIAGGPLHKRIFWGTEATVHDTLRMTDHLPLVRKAGLRAIWLGVEDMTATLINKGQSVPGTMRAFSLLQSAGILPMPMMMHHDSQPLLSRRDAHGLLNQVYLLRKAGAITLQVLMISPAPGSRSYEETFTSGLVLQGAGRMKVEAHMLDGNYVIASKLAKPWRKQFNILLAYLYFYNPLQLLLSMIRLRSTLYPAGPTAQMVGMAGLGHTVRRTLGWAMALLLGKIRRTGIWPQSSVPIRQLASAPRLPAIDYRKLFSGHLTPTMSESTAEFPQLSRLGVGSTPTKLEFPEVTPEVTP
jgi:radical SAM superfamily enzyme YgiQ (UPF0313 family)